MAGWRRPHRVTARAGRQTLAAMNALMLEEHTLFITDTFVNEEPSAEQLAEIAQMAALEVQRFGVPPKGPGPKVPFNSWFPKPLPDVVGARRARGHASHDLGHTSFLAL